MKMMDAKAIGPDKKQTESASGNMIARSGFTAAFIAFWSLFVIVPVLGLLIWPFIRYENYAFIFSPTTEAIRTVLDSGRYQVTLTTLRIAATITVIELLIALPFSIWLVRGLRSNLARSLILAALAIPFFLSLASRTIVWRALLGTTGPVNTVLMQFGLVSEPLDWLLFSEFAVHLGLLGPSFPTMVFPIYLALTLIDDELFEAAADLGASPIRMFLDVILPLAAPGILAGIIFTFVPMLGETVVPALLGGGHVSMLGGSINSLIGVLNYPVASALGLIVLCILILLLVILRGLGRGRISLASAFAEMRK